MAKVLLRSLASGRSSFVKMASVVPDGFEVAVDSKWLLFRTQDPTAQQCIKHSGETRAPNSAQNGMLLTPPDVTMHRPS